MLVLADKTAIVWIASKPGFTNYQPPKYSGALRKIEKELLWKILKILQILIIRKIWKISDLFENVWKNFEKLNSWGLTSMEAIHKMGAQ